MLKVRRKHLPYPVSGSLVACDTETTGVSPWSGDRPYMFSFCNEEGESAVVRFAVDPLTRRVKYEERPAQLRMLRRFFSDPRIVKVFWNGKFDVRMIRFGLNVKVAGEIHEGMFAAHCCNSSEFDFGLKPMAKKYAGFDDADEKALQDAVVALRKIAKSRGWKIDPEEVKGDYWLCEYATELGHPEWQDLGADYAGKDAERTMLLWLFYLNKMEVLEVRRVYDDEMALWPHVLEMEDRGVRLDKKVAAKLYAMYTAERDHYLADLMRAGEAARLAGSLGTRGVGTVTEVTYYKRSGEPNKVRVLLDGADKDKWFKAEHVSGDLEEGGRCVVDEPFKQKVFNPGSDEQLAKLLYDDLKLPVPEAKAYRAKKKKGTSRPVDADTLLELSASCPLVDNILKWRTATKALSFLDAYEKYTHHDDELDIDLLHADFNQVGPKTGRFSCRTPNLQQAANKSASRSVSRAFDSRAPFGPRPGHVWYCIDYSQLEVRIFADLAQETEMIKLINSGRHIHAACADHVWGFRDGKPTDVAIKAAYNSMGWDVGEANDSPEQRALRARFKGMDPERACLLWLTEFNGSIVDAEASLGRKNTHSKAKMAVFTKLFGGGIPSVMSLWKCTREEAQTFLDEYAEAFPKMNPWMKATTRQARRDGYAMTAYGRRVVLDDPDKAYRAVNYRVQGSAADLMKRGMRNCAEYLRSEHVKAWLLMTIHDELVFEFDMRERRMEHVLQLKRIMEDDGGVFGLRMKTKVEKVVREWSTKEDVSWANAG